MLPLETTVGIHYCSHSTVCTQVYKIVCITLAQTQLLLPVYKVTLQVTLKPAREYGLTVTVLHSVIILYALLICFNWLSYISH